MKNKMGDCIFNLLKSLQKIPAELSTPEKQREFLEREFLTHVFNEFSEVITPSFLERLGKTLPKDQVSKMGRGLIPCHAFVRTLERKEVSKAVEEVKEYLNNVISCSIGIAIWEILQKIDLNVKSEILAEAIKEVARCLKRIDQDNLKAVLCFNKTDQDDLEDMMKEL
jgi:hypothetical protein